jgi:soluble lytic murein transglycosylase
MARSPAGPLEKVALAAGAYVAFWALLFAAAVPRRPAPAPVVAAAAHARSAAGWTAVAPRVYDEVERRMPGHASAQRHRVARTILEEATRAAMDPLLVLAMIQVESAFDPRALSPVGAAGLMQLLPPTMHEELGRWRLAGADPFDPVANVRAGVRYLERLLGTFDDLELALMAYNAGPGRIRRHLRGGVVPERFLSYPRDVSRARARLSGAGAAPRLARAHGPAELRAAAARAGGLVAPLPPLRPPSVRPAAPIAAAVPGGSRRRDLTDS